MIKSFRHKGLQEVFDAGKSKHVSADQVKRILNRLDALRNANSLTDLAIPGFNTHPLAGTNPPRYSIKVTAQWRITFEWHDKEGATLVDLEQYH